MNLKHELTFPRAVRVIARWWWFLILCGLVFLAAAYLVAGRGSTTQYQATARVHAVATLVSYNPRGDPIPTTVVPRTANEVKIEDFLLDSAASEAVSKLRAPNLTAGQLLAGLEVAPLSPTDVRLTYQAPSEERAKAILSAYVNEYVLQRRDREQRALAQAIESLQAQLASVRKSLRSLPAPGQGTGEAAAASTASAYTVQRLELTSGISRLKLASDLIPEQIAPVGRVEATASQRGLPPELTAAGGLVAGLVTGLLAVLLLTRFDPRVRRPSDLHVPGIRVVDIGSKHTPEATQRLRLELEVAGLGRVFNTLAMTSATRAEARTDLAFELAQAFAVAGTPTVLVSADLSGRREHPASPPLLKSGVASFLGGAVDGLESVAITENLAWIPKGENSLDAEPMFTSEKVALLLAEAESLGQVIILDAPSLDDPSGLLLATSAELTLVVVQRARTSWSSLETALELLQRSAHKPVQICFDRSGRPASSKPARMPFRGRSRFSSATPARP